MGIKCELKHNKRHDNSKMTRRYYHLQNIYIQYMNTNKQAVGFKNNMKKYGFYFQL